MADPNDIDDLEWTRDHAPDQLPAMLIDELNNLGCTSKDYYKLASLIRSMKLGDAVQINRFVGMLYIDFIQGPVLEPDPDPAYDEPSEEPD